MEHEPQQAKLKSFFAEDNERYTFYFDLDPQELPLKVDAYMRASTPMEEALLLAIDALNLQLIPTRGLALRRESSLYKPRLAGKNFKPKSDLPALSLNQKICDLKVAQVAVQLLNREKALFKVEASHPQSGNTVPEQAEKAKQNLEEADVAVQLEKVELSSKEAEEGHSK